ncbi:hypothetical protein T11_15904 [Trichinella zimbabwensis]|uniref:Uncharacterized protein n=1 Tax=Trichinella zimbabwensis TaxID=268475 RepID=A0A0V1GIN0_9BILA|nr:hypothetical protein T11_15904 [Trichinella zimbabwensis]
MSAHTKLFILLALFLTFEYVDARTMDMVSLVIAIKGTPLEI